MESTIAPVQSPANIILMIAMCMRLAKEVRRRLHFLTGWKPFLTL